MQLTSCRGTCRRPDQGARCASPVSCDFLTFHRAVDFRVESSIIGSEVAGTVGCNSRIILATGDIVGLQETRIEKSQVAPMIQADSLSFFLLLTRTTQPGFFYLLAVMLFVFASSLSCNSDWYC